MSSPPRVLFAVMPSAQWAATTLQRLIELGLEEALGGDMFSPENWHQSLSERIFNPTAEQCERLQRVGASISAHACTLQFNRIEGPDLKSDRQHCTLRAYGVPKAFKMLRDAVRAALVEADFAEIATGVTPHITLSYEANRFFANITIEPPISWALSELYLIVGGGDPYRYEVIGRWPLLRDLDPPVAQEELFP